jgi:hypothetical protein
MRNPFRRTQKVHPLAKIISTISTELANVVFIARNTNLKSNSVANSEALSHNISHCHNDPCRFMSQAERVLSLDISDFEMLPVVHIASADAGDFDSYLEFPWSWWWEIVSFLHDTELARCYMDNGGIFSYHSEVFRSMELASFEHGGELN